MDWFSFFIGFFAATMITDIMWRITHHLTLKLVEAQRSLIDKLRRDLEC